MGDHASADIEPRKSRPPLSSLLKRRAFKELYKPRPAPVTFPLGKKMDTLYPFVAETIGDVAVTYLEFGVFRGASIRRMAKLFPHKDARFYGFDSFEGLPQEWGAMEKGAFSTEGSMPDVPDPRVSFIKGYFQNTFPQFIRNLKLTDTVIIHYDADLYSSTLFLMTTIWHFIPQYYFMFDEFVPDESIAMHDFCAAFPVDYTFLACTTPPHKLRPTQLFGRMENTAFHP